MNARVRFATSYRSATLSRFSAPFVSSSARKGTVELANSSVASFTADDGRPGLLLTDTANQEFRFTARSRLGNVDLAVVVIVVVVVVVVVVADASLVMAGVKRSGTTGSAR